MNNKSFRISNQIGMASLKIKLEAKFKKLIYTLSRKIFQ
jgi:hypothetical protein